MLFEPLEIPDVIRIMPQRIGDPRGYFMETYNARLFKEAGIVEDFVQDNHSHSTITGTVRGLHLQRDPWAQGKLVQVVRGSVMDVAVDARAHSPTRGQWVKALLTQSNHHQLYIPPGFLHGFVTLEPNTEFLYKVSNFYHRESEQGVRWDDPTLAIPWGVGSDQAHVSAKDQALPLWKEFVESQEKG